MKTRPFKITMHFKGQVPDKIWFKRFSKAVRNGMFSVNAFDKIAHTNQFYHYEI